ncbi:TetR/AcrR family transcriptional regulator [Ruania zhangjianzhongii]|uniref:TetR/AcrR family transcriptional regulator n=1 Tax=Ruania zhangjianzhongii TaxID=2603206 RepID=UPI0011CAB711|nr:TetR/AcrR family transcriptional regulator [Ruania zhangjianzhongii]
MAHARTPRTSWIDRGLEALAAGGVDAVRVEPIAAQLGVTKGGFYGYFSGRDQLLAEMLSTWETDVTEGVIAVVEADSGHEARERVRRLALAINVPDRVTMRVDTEVAIREWARRDVAAAEVLARVDQQRTAYLRGLFGEFCSPEEADARTAVAVSVRLTSYFMDFGHPGRAHEEVVELVVRELLS